MRFIEFAVYNKSNKTFDRINNVTFSPNKTDSEQDIISKIKRGDIIVPAYVTHIRFIYGSGINEITDKTNYYEI